MWSTVRNDPKERQAFFALLDEYLDQRGGSALPASNSSYGAATSSPAPVADSPSWKAPVRRPAGLTTVERNSTPDPEQAAEPAAAPTATSPMGTSLANSALKNRMLTNTAFRAAGASPLVAAAASHAAAQNSERLAPHVAAAAGNSIREGSWRGQRQAPAGLTTAKAGVGKTILNTKGPLSKEEAQKKVFVEPLAYKQPVHRSNEQAGPPPLAPRQASSLGSVQAQYDYTGTDADDLAVQHGERLTVVEHVSEDWWRCRNARGEEGLVPANYLASI